MTDHALPNVSEDVLFDDASPDPFEDEERSEAEARQKALQERRERLRADLIRVAKKQRRLEKKMLRHRLQLCREEASILNSLHFFTLQEISEEMAELQDEIAAVDQVLGTT